MISHGEGTLEPNVGRYGGYINRFDQYEVSLWIWEQIQAARGVTTAQPPVRPDKPTLITKKEVVRQTGLAPMTIYRLVKQGKFPQPIPLKVAA